MKSSYKIALVIAAVLCLVVFFYFHGQASPDQPAAPIENQPLTEASTPASAQGAGSSSASSSSDSQAGSSSLAGRIHKYMAQNGPSIAGQTASSKTASGPETAATTASSGEASANTPVSDASATPALATGSDGVPELRLDDSLPTQSKTQPAASATTVTTVAAKPPAPTTYTIKPGDTFSSIAIAQFGDQKYMQQISQANPTVDPRKLKVGQVIRLPAKASLDQPAPTLNPGSSDAVAAEAAAKHPQYVIKAGDTLSDIAGQYYSDPSLWRTIYNANKSKIGSNPDKLKAGMKLTIPPAPKGAQ